MGKEKAISLEEALDDVEARFLYNLPAEELSKPDRLFFQIEQAYWYYEDFKADKIKSLPHFKKLETFAQKIFEHCPMLHANQDKFKELFLDFRVYKSKIPVCGVILLNSKMNKILLVRDYNTGSWMFPRGKINEGESEFACAIRETKEEIGFDTTRFCKEDNVLVSFQDGKKVIMYIATNVPENKKFSPQTRKEIAEIDFHHLDYLPKQSYGVLLFLPKLKRWIKANNPKSQKNNQSKASPKVQGLPLPQKYNNFDARNTDTFGSITDSGGATKDKDLKKGWGVEAMFQANSKITGINYNYDGNPHDFGSAHPKYVNYNTSPSAVNSQSIIMSALSSTNNFSLDVLSKQSLKGEELLRKNKQRGKSIGQQEFALPPKAPNTKPISSTTSSRQWFISPFHGKNKVKSLEEIMGVVDNVLVQTILI